VRIELLAGAPANQERVCRSFSKGVNMGSPFNARIRLRALAVAVSAVCLIAAATATATPSDRQGGDPQTGVPVFVLDKGRFTVFDPPGTGANEFADINRRGKLAGTYIDAADANHGFVRDKHGHVTTFDVAGAKQTYVFKINDRGQMVGNTCDAVPCPDERHAFLREADGRTTTIRVPGSVATQAFGLDDRGSKVVGDYVDAAGADHGYVWEAGRLTTIDVPDATMTQVTGINDRGEMVGIYVDAAGEPHGFFRDTRGRFTPIDAPDVRYTLPFDLNDRGQIAGFTTDAFPLPSATDVHGFVLRAGPGGPLTRIDVPGAPRTLASGIDDRGRIAGLYENPKVAMPLMDAVRLGPAERRES
jgi:hypothetical protein